MVTWVGWIHWNDTYGRDGIQCTSRIVEHVDMRCTILLVCEVEYRVSVLDSTFDSTLDLSRIVYKIILLHVELRWQCCISRLLWIWIIFIETSEINMSSILQEEEWIAGRICLNHYSLVFAVQWFVTIHCCIQLVSTWLQVREVE